MAALSTTQEQIENRNTKSEKVVPFNSTPDAESLKFTLFDLIVLILSVLSIFTDLCTGEVMSFSHCVYMKFIIFHCFNVYNWKNIIRNT